MEVRSIGKCGGDLMGCNLARQAPFAPRRQLAVNFQGTADVRFHVGRMRTSDAIGAFFRPTSNLIIWVPAVMFL